MNAQVVNEGFLEGPSMVRGVQRLAVEALFHKYPERVGLLPSVARGVVVLGLFSVDPRIQRQ